MTRFIHAHAAWFDANGDLRGGHLLPETVIGANGVTVLAHTLQDATQHSADDPESRLPVFTPTESQAPNASPNGDTTSARVAVIARVCPGENLLAACGDLMRAHGLRSARVGGSIGSLVGAALQRPSGVLWIDGPATEVALTGQLHLDETGSVRGLALRHRHRPSRTRPHGRPARREHRGRHRGAVPRGSPMNRDAHPEPSDLGLTDAVILVFGAGSSGAGLSNGEAAALTYARAGARVACIDRDPAEAERVTKGITAEGGTALAVQADVTVEDDVDPCRAEGRLDLGGSGGHAQQRRRRGRRRGRRPRTRASGTRPWP